MLYLLTLTNFCFAQTQTQTQANIWSDEILVYIIFDILFLVTIIALVKLVGMSAKLSKYY